eukprot:scpid72243/ scgid28806/ 
MMNCSSPPAECGIERRNSGPLFSILNSLTAGVRYCLDGFDSTGQMDASRGSQAPRKKSIIVVVASLEAKLHGSRPWEAQTVPIGHRESNRDFNFKERLSESKTKQN